MTAPHTFPIFVRALWRSNIAQFHCNKSLSSTLLAPRVISPARAVTLHNFEFLILNFELTRISKLRIKNSKLPVRFLNIDQVLDLVYLAAKLEAVRELHGLVEAVETQSFDSGPLILRVTDDALDPSYTKLLAFHRYLAEIRLCHVRLLTCPNLHRDYRGCRARHAHCHYPGRHAFRAPRAEEGRAS